MCILLYVEQIFQSFTFYPLWQDLSHLMVPIYMEKLKEVPTDDELSP